MRSRTEIIAHILFAAIIEHWDRNVMREQSLAWSRCERAERIENMVGVCRDNQPAAKQHGLRIHANTLWRAIPAQPIAFFIADRIAKSDRTVIRDRDRKIVVQRAIAGVD